MRRGGNVPGPATSQFSLVGLGLTTRLGFAIIIAAIVWLMVLSVVLG